MLSITGGLKTKSGVSSVSGGNTLEVTPYLEIMRLKIKATNEISQSMFLSHDQSQGAIQRIKFLHTNSLVATKVMILSWEQLQDKE